MTDMNKRCIEIKRLIKDEVCLGTYGLVELELKDIEKDNEHRLIEFIKYYHNNYFPEDVDVNEIINKFKEYERR